MTDENDLFNPDKGNNDHEDAPLFESDAEEGTSLRLDDIDNPLEHLVGEGKKFKDYESLAKGKLESDRHISNLEAELQGIRKELKTRLSIEEALERIEAQRNQDDDSSQPNREGEPPEGSDDIKSLSPEEIDKLVESKLTEAQRKTTTQQNVDRVKTELRKRWGKDFHLKLKDRATNDLKVSEQFLAQMAESHPDAFLKLVLDTDDTGLNLDLAPPRSDVRSGSFGDGAGSRMGWKHFERMRKEDPNRYWSKETQREIHELRKSMGESFYSR